MPPKFVAFVLQLDDLGNHREAFDPGQQRIFRRLAEPLGEGEELFGRQLLVAEHYDEMVEQRLTHFLRRFGIEALGEVHAGELRSQRASHFLDSQRSHGFVACSRNIGIARFSTWVR